MATIWHRRRKAAREAGEYHALGGPDTRAHHASLGQDCADAYDDAFKDRVAALDLVRERSTHPLRQIISDANAVWRRSDDSDVAELANLIEQLAQYTLDKEEQA